MTQIRRLIFTLLLWSIPVLALSSGSSFGIIWSPPQSYPEIKKELGIFQDNGIQHLIIEGVVDYGIMDFISRYDFEITILTTDKFLSREMLSQKKEFLETQLLDYQFYYSGFSDVTSISSFSFSDIYSETSHSFYSYLLVKVITRRFKLSIISRNLFPDTFLADSLRLILYHDSQSDDANLTSSSYHSLIYTFDRFSIRDFQHIVQSAGNRPIYLKSEDYFRELEDSTSKLQRAIIAFSKDSQFLFDLPKESDESQQSMNGIIILFWVFVGLFAVHFSFEPNYRKSISRYFFAHSFFTDDILNKRIRFGTSLFLVMFNQALLFALVKYTVLNHILNDLALEEISYHYPFLIVGAESILGYVLFNAMIYLCFELFTFLWLFVAIKPIKHYYQVLTLLLWPQHLNFLCAAIIITFEAAGYSQMVSLIAFAIYIMVIILSFPIAAHDSIKQFGGSGTYYQYLTYYPYIILLILLFFWLLPSSGFYSVLDLILTL